LARGVNGGPPTTNEQIPTRARRFIRLFVVPFVVGLLALLAFLLLRDRPDALREIQARGAWRVGMDPSFPPFEFVDGDGQAAGLDVDLARAIGGELGIETELVILGFDELMDAVAAHRVDAAISALPILPERTQEVRFSDPYAQAGVVLAVRRGSPIRAPGDLAARTVAVEWGSQGDAAARRLNSDAAPPFALQPFDTVTAALDALAAGEVDAALVDAISLATHPAAAKLTAPGDPLVSDPYVVVVPADAPDLLDAVNGALAALERDGRLEGLREKWLRPPATE
jgi:ABC-type amino acid transport substrate-binding protein